MPAREVLQCPLHGGQEVWREVTIGPAHDRTAAWDLECGHRVTDLGDGIELVVPVEAPRVPRNKPMAYGG